MKKRQNRNYGFTERDNVFKTHISEVPFTFVQFAIDVCTEGQFLHLDLSYK